jgi:hypothetical protein
MEEFMVKTVSFTQELNEILPDISAPQAAELVGFIARIINIPTSDEILSTSVSEVEEWAKDQGFNGSQLLHDIKLIAVNSAAKSDQNQLAASWDEWISSDMSAMKLAESLNTQFPDSARRLADFAVAALHEDMELEATGGGKGARIGGGFAAGSIITGAGMYFYNWYRSRGDREVIRIMGRINDDLMTRNRALEVREENLKNGVIDDRPTPLGFRDNRVGPRVKESGAKNEISTQTEGIASQTEDDVIDSADNTLKYSDADIMEGLSGAE